MPTLDDFFTEPSPTDRLVGTYLWPHRFLGLGVYDDPASATRIIAPVEVDGRAVLLTQNGGLFLPPPADLPALSGQHIPDEEEFWRKVQFEVDAADAFNQVICELALHGEISEPALPAHISAAKVIEGHALITSHGGAAHIANARVLGPSLALVRGDTISWPVCSLDLLNEVLPLTLTKRVAAVSPTLPTLIAAAYYLYLYRQLAEALADAWIVVEQVLDHWWRGYVDKLQDPLRRSKLSDTRTYSAAVRLEFLRTAGELSSDLFDALDDARDRRNKLLHRARIDVDATTSCMRAMQLAIEAVCQQSVAPPQLSHSISW